MKVKDVMVSDVRTCAADDDLGRAAGLMWEHDCGVVPVVEADDYLVGVITDRDVCMAAYTQGLPLAAIRVGDVMARQVKSVRPEEDERSAAATMRSLRVRRVPVVDALGRVVGIVSLADLARGARRERTADGRSALDTVVLDTLAEICRPWKAEPDAALPAPVERASVRRPQRA